MGLRRSERQVEYRAEVVFELAGTRAVDAPVRGVVRTHGQLVDQQTAVAGLEQLDGQDPDDVQLGGDGRDEALRFQRQSAREARCGRDDLDRQIPSR